MDNNILTIQLKPSYSSTAESMGFNLQTDEIDSEAVLFNQGLDIDEMEVEVGEEFKISSQFENGIVSCEENNYKLIAKDENGRVKTTENEISIFLEPGKYLFHDDGITIEKIT
ncbi:MAG: hypothetical protein SGI89_14530 [bacterium]|nr:hypothetical protein [bacterium]